MLPIKAALGRLVPQDGAFARAAARLRDAEKRTRIGFVIDATQSRSRTWEEAQVAQRRVFESSERLRRAAVRLIHFGGATLKDHGWSAEAKTLAAAMAPISCVAGATQILDALRRFLDDKPDDRAEVVMVIGDCFEESLDAIPGTISALRAAGIKLYAFHEGADRLGRDVYERLARETGGRFFSFGPAMPLGDLFEAVAVLAAGGTKAVARLTHNPAVPFLLAPPKKGNGR